MFIRRLFSTLLLASVAATSAHAADIGVRTLSVPAPERGRDIAVTVWYPAGAGGTPTMIGDNRLFKGAAARENAPIAGGRFPLVLLSHGSGSSVEAMSWLANALAEAGFIVAGPNHPGTTSGDSTPAETVKLWQRTTDLSAMIDRLSSDPEWRMGLDPARIGVVGFSLGGAAAMEISGARASLDAYARYCDGYDQGDCAWFARGVGYVDGKPIKVDKLDLRKVDKARFEQLNRDPRIRTAVLVDAGLAQAYDADSLRAIDIPLSFINLGSAGTIPESVISDGLARLVPQASYATVRDSWHYSFLPECKPDGLELLKAEGEVDPICDETTSRPRADIHEELKGMIVDTLQKNLKGSF